MTKLVLIVIIILLIIILISTSNKYLKNRYKIQPISRNIFIVLVLVSLLILGFGILGIRLTPLQASSANEFVEDHAELLEEIKVGENFLHIYYNPREKLYRITVTEHIGKPKY